MPDQTPAPSAHPASGHRASSPPPASSMPPTGAHSVPGGAGPAERAVVVDLAAIRHNVATLRSWVQPAALMAVVKADAYGHGMIPVAQAALQAGATWLGVAHVTEALSLRSAGITAPVVAWLHTRSTPFGRAIEEGIDLGVSGWELEAIAESARRLQQPARVHLKVDTGLGRNGATLADWPTVTARAATLQEQGLIRVVGVFSHLAVADDLDREEETDEQLAQFHQAVEIARGAGLHVDVRHLANTPATLVRPETHLDLVRVGLGIYGLSPFDRRPASDFGLRPAMSLTTTVANSKTVPAGQGISYGYLYRTPEPTRLALVPLGYGDGIPRTAMEAPVWIGGRRAEVTGRIAMDQFVVDLGTEEDVAPVGSPVELFGPASGITADDWARAARTINYEIVTRVGARIPKVHVDTRPGEDIGSPTGEGR
ncbi:alanine racemase [Micrococcus terreus]|uniref:Alanine racemase n=1 Tax=Micrococcus terreus TaxID=574650 RepID=A0A1I7ME41_9MICC|nr:alanine racemase [Micrococcus terreus]